MQNTPPLSTPDLDGKSRSPLLARMRQTSAPLFWTGIGLLLLACLSLILVVLDPRLLQGVSVWLKPWKFQFSTGVYLLSLLLFMVWLPKELLCSRAAHYVVWVAIVSGLFEVAYITWQGAHGRASHFNIATRFDSLMYTAMGVGAGLLVSASLVLGILVARTKAYALPATLKLAIVLGLLVTFVLGAGFGGYLSGQRSGHWVATAATDAGGLPLLAWSRSGGDLRVAHFFGIHAMHFIPIFGWALHRSGLRQTRAAAALWGSTAFYCGLCFWTFFQALRGQPFWA